MAMGFLSYPQIFPDELLEPTYFDPENHERLLARSEVERRHHYIEQLGNIFPSGEQHAFVQLLRRCLHNEQLETYISRVINYIGNTKG